MVFKNTKIYLALLIAALSPLISFAANNVTLAEDVIIDVNGVNLTVTGHTATVDTLAVSAATFDVTLDGGQELKVSSADRRTFDVSGALGSTQVSTSCSSSESILTLNNPSGGVQVTLTVGPTSSTCSTGGGGIVGGGGGGISAPTIAAQPTITPPPVAVPAPEVAKPSPVAQLVSPVFNSALRLGNRSADIKRLQQLLNSDPDTKLTDSGLGSPGNETDFFGALTRAAVKAFQVKYGIVSSGDEATTGYGLVGPKTRAKLAEVFSQVKQVAAPESAVSEVETLQSQINGLLEQIKTLQEQLNAQQSVAPAVPTAPAPSPSGGTYNFLKLTPVPKYGE